MQEKILRKSEILSIIRLYIFDSFARKLLPKLHGNKVAILRLDAIGDFIVWQTYARYLRESYPDQELVLICNALYADMARSLPHWDRVIPVAPNLINNEFSARWKLLRELRNQGFQTLLNPTYSRTAQGDLLVRAIDATNAIGMLGDWVNIPSYIKRHSDKWYRKLVPSNGAWQPEWDRAKDFMSAILNRELSWQRPSLSMPGQAFIGIVSKPYFVLFPGASSSDRKWPAGHFIEIGKWLSISRAWTAVVAGGPDDSGLAETICSGIGSEAINLAGRTSIVGLAEYLRNASIVISNETSAVHIAAAVGVPCVAIVGGGHYGRFMPYPAKIGLPTAAVVPMPCFKCNWECIYQKSANGLPPCVEAVGIPLVKEAVNEALKTVAA